MQFMLDKDCPWEDESSDPSVALSPFTLERMREGWFVEQVELFPHTPIESVSRVDAMYLDDLSCCGAECVC